MSNELKPSAKRQRDFAIRKQEEHRKCTLWLELDDLKKIEAYAEQQGWLNKTGRNSGKPNLQKTVSALLKAALDQLEQVDEQK